MSDSLGAFTDAACDVVVDFTVADAARVTLPWLAEHGIHAVVGTTGFTPEDFAVFETVFASDGGPNCVIAPNFAISAVLMMRFAEMAAPFFDTAEIIELHHDRKIDAPSGTAVKTAERMAGGTRRSVRSRSDDRRGLRGCSWRRRPERYPCPLGAHAGDGRSPGGDTRRPGPDADDPPGQLRPRQLHARRRPRVQEDHDGPGPVEIPRPLPRLITSGVRPAM